MSITFEKFEEMVVEVTDWLHHASEYEQRLFRNMSEDSLIDYQVSLGRSIRNHFCLWNNDWDPIIDNDVDVSDDHPDAISMRVIREVWRRETNAT